MKAELHSAFVFDCDNCGAENFIRAIEGNLDEEAAKYAAADHVSQHYDTVADMKDDGSEQVGHVDWIISRIAIAPKQVSCGLCGTVFDSELAHEEESEEN